MFSLFFLDYLTFTMVETQPLPVRIYSPLAYFFVKVKFSSISPLDGFLTEIHLKEIE